MGKQMQGRTLEDCIQKVMLFRKPNVSKNLLAYDLMLNLPTDDIDVDLEYQEARKELEKEGITGEEKEYIEAKLYVLELMDRYR